MSDPRHDEPYDDNRYEDEYYDEEHHDQQSARGGARDEHDSRAHGRSPGRHAHAADNAVAIRRVSWGAIIAGGLIALTVWVMLSLLGAGIGFGIAQPTEGASATNTGVSIAGLIWWIVSGLIATGVGGYVAARMAGVTKAMDGVLQGVTTWAATTLLMIYLLSSAAGTVIGGAFSMVSGVASAAGQSAETVAPKVAQATGVSPKDIKSQVTDLFDKQPPMPPEKMNREQAASAMTGLVPKLIGDGPESKQAYQRATKIVAAQTDISQQQAKQKVDQLQKKAQSAAKQAKQAASSAANYTSMASFAGFVMLLLGLGAGAAGGAAGKRPPREHS